MNLKERLLNGKTTIAIFGIGFVGTTIMTVWLRAGARVIAVDKNIDVLEKLRKGESPTNEPHSKRAISKGLKENKLIITSDHQTAIRKSNVVIIAVPVGLKNKNVNLTNITSVINSISKEMKKGIAIIVTPTIPIGTSKKIIKIIENKTKLKVEKDFNYIYSPERISAGHAVKDIEKNYPAIISGAGKKSTEFGKKLFNIISSKGVIEMSTIEAAEGEKIFEGVYRDVNIALANELAIICEKNGLDFWEIRNAANSQPYSQIHKSGIGVGGYCIPVYPYFLINMNKKSHEYTNLIRVSRKINEGMPRHAVKRIIEITNNKFRSKKKIKISILGLSFRGDIPDKRLSPTYEIVKMLTNIKFDIFIHDPYFEKDKFLEKRATITKDLRKCLMDSDIVILATDHREYYELTDSDMKKLLKNETVIYDGRNVIQKITKNKIIKIGKG